MHFFTIVSLYLTYFLIIGRYKRAIVSYKDNSDNKLLCKQSTDERTRQPASGDLTFNLKAHLDLVLFFKVILPFLASESSNSTLFRIFSKLKCLLIKYEC